MNSEVIFPGSKKSNSFFYVIAITLLTMRICSYFMLSEEVAITQALKICLRISVTVATGILLMRQNTSRKNSQIDFNQPLSMVLYLIYIGLGIASLLWTTSFTDTLLHLLMDVETLLFCFLYMKLILLKQEEENSDIRASRIVAVSIFLICASFLIGKMVNPEKFFRLTHGGEEARLGGFIINPNELGMLIVIGISTTFIELKHSFNKWSKWLMMILMIYALIITGSRSSMIGLLLIILFFVSQSKTRRMQVVILAGLCAVAPYVIHQVFIKQGDVEEVMSLTGRLPFWKDLVTINFPREPLLGYGYMRIDYTDKFESINSYTGGMTHNTFLQVLMGLGLTGLFIVFAQLASTIHGMVTHTNWNKRRLCMAMLIPVLVNSFTEFGVFGETNYGIMFYLFIVFTVVLKPAEQFSRITSTHANSAGSFLRSSVTA
ncbi:MAG: O-antigen ligase family protein [Bacteroidota bacterium]